MRGSNGGFGWTIRSRVRRLWVWRRAASESDAILVPIDFSDHADPVIEWAAHLAEEHGSEIVLLHAYHVPVEFQQAEGAYLPADFWTAVKEEARQSLAQYGERLRARGLPSTR